MPDSRITAADFTQLLRDEMPASSTPFDVLELSYGRAVLRVVAGTGQTRPGGTVAGPFLFGISDLAAYAAVLSVVGRVPLAVTTDATIHFLRRPRATTLLARARVIKEGSRLVVIDVEVAHEDESALLAHSVMSYSVPPARPAAV
jgi:acyl-coenzyme A thioesterase PaaI-like protein